MTRRRHDRVVLKVLQVPLPGREDAADVADDVPLLEDVEHLERDGGRHRVGVICARVRKPALLVAALQQARVELLRHDDSRDRRIGTRHRLRAGDAIRLCPNRLATPHGPGSPEPGDDLVHEKVDAVAVEHRFHSREILSGGRQHTGRDRHGLGDKRPDRLGTGSFDRAIELGRQTIRVGFF
jgi:hypothetical protein